MTTSAVRDAGALYTRVLGLTFQILGDVALARQAATTACLRWAARAGAERDLWQITAGVLRDYLARGFQVRPLDPEGQHAALLSALYELEPVDRMMVLLRYHEGLSVEDVAAVVGADVATVREALVRTRQMLMSENRAHDEML